MSAQRLLPGPKSRSDAKQRLADEHFDLLVLGGGITGAGIALDAVTRGLRVALIDKADFASGTSSKSSKMIHGGLRYLEHGELGLMRASARERELLSRLSPHLVTPLGFVLPVSKRSRRRVAAGLWIYDLLAGRGSHRRHRRIDGDELEGLIPGLKREEGYLYYDSQTDDVRLTLSILFAARSYGAVVCNYLQAVGFNEVAGNVLGARVGDSLSGEEFDISAVDTVNATGVWADEVLAMAGEVREWIRPSKGIHLVFPKTLLPLKAAVLLPASGRFVFAEPWRSSSIVGTTDSAHVGSLEEPEASAEEAQTLLAAVSKSFDREFTLSDVRSTYAGLRPLLADASRQATRDLSRRHKLINGPKALITITGGKLTTYRAMAKEVVDLVVRRRSGKSRSVTRTLRLGPKEPQKMLGDLKVQCADLGLEPDVAESLFLSYGSSARSVVQLARNEDLARRLVDRLPYLEAEAAWAGIEEMAVTPDDVLARRTRIALEDENASAGSETKVAEIMSALKPSA